MPLGALLLIGAPLLLAESREPRGRRGNDWTGAVLSVITLAALVLALIEGREYGWSGRTGPVAFVVAVAGLVAFRAGRTPA